MENRLPLHRADALALRDQFLAPVDQAVSQYVTLKPPAGVLCSRDLNFLVVIEYYVPEDEKDDSNFFESSFLGCY